MLSQNKGNSRSAYPGREFLNTENTEDTEEAQRGGGALSRKLSFCKMASDLNFSKVLELTP